MTRSGLALAICGALAMGPAALAGEKRLEWSTPSADAKAALAELQKGVENFQPQAALQALAQKIVAADPQFAMGHYYLSAVTPPPENQKHLQKAAELAARASDGERRFIETMVVARSARALDAQAALDQLAADFPGERVVQMLRGQLLMGAGRLDEALAAFDKALKIDDSTARAHTLAANIRILKGEYAAARKGFEASLARLPKGTAPGAQRYGTAFTYLYEGQPARAIEVLRTYVDEYKNAGSPFGFPEVFIWNSIARIHLENGQLPEAMSAYEKGYASVPGSGLDETQKKIWLGRLHHGKGRTLARLGQHDAAWKEAQIIRRMIDEGGEQGKQFEPAWHYIAGYLKLESGDVPGALTHLKQASPQDPFHKLLLARAYERAGDKASAKKAYEEVAAFNQNTLERALSYPEAKKKISAN